MAVGRAKYNLRTDGKQMAIAAVRMYNARKDCYNMARESLIESAGVFNKTGHDINAFVHSPRISDPTYACVLSLSKLDELTDTRVMRVVEAALDRIGGDCTVAVRARLRDAIYNSCVYGRNFKFERIDIPFGKSDFYKRRAAFLRDVFVGLGYAC